MLGKQIAADSMEGRSVSAAPAECHLHLKALAEAQLTLMLLVCHLQPNTGHSLSEFCILAVSVVHREQPQKLKTTQVVEQYDV